MCDQTEINYLDGEVVWVKLGSCWWPGEVVGPEKLPPDVLPSFRKPPIAVVKFFLEDTYEYVKNINSIYKYNCSRKNEFISKGLYMYRTKHGLMEKFPEDIIRAESAVGGDVEILARDEFQETKKESYAGLFGDQVRKSSGSGKTGKSGRGRPSESPKNSTPMKKFHKEKSDYKVHILLQGSKTPSTFDASASNIESAPSTSCTESESVEQKSDEVETPVIEKPKNIAKPASSFSTPVASSSGIYACHACSFTTTRLNVLILHNKTHSVTFIPYTPSPVRKKVATKLSSKSTPNSSMTPKARRPRKEKTEKTSKKSPLKKRLADENSDSSDAKKTKTDEEIKSSLLADWDDGDEESNDESPTMVMAGSPEIPVAPGSPAVPTPAELPTTQIPSEIPSPLEKKPECSPTSEKPESSSDSKYEFCEDEDWPLEADGGRKIPRVKNPKRKEETKSLSLDDDDMAREVAELLNKTTVPDLPSAPEPLKVEENFPEPSVVKSPDKKDDKSLEKQVEKSATETVPTKAIFKTKTFFRSRHSRSQDAIGKYVAEQLNAVERMDISESEINGSDVVSSPEARESPPIEQVKVARLAPKIQLKKMKAEAAQLRELEKTNFEQFEEVHDLNLNQSGMSTTNTINSTIETADEQIIKDEENVGKVSSLQDVLYPTQEIIPVTEEPHLTRSLISKEDIESNSNTNTLTKIPIEDKNVLENNKIDKIDIPNDTEPDTTTKDIENMMEIIEYPEVNAQQSYEQAIEPFMNESTASAVDALLSVSRETDRVTRLISNDPPEDLFEDDVKDTGTSNSVNGFNESMDVDNDVCKEIELENVIQLPEVEKVELTQEINTFQQTEILQNEVVHDRNAVILPADNDMCVNEEQEVNNKIIENIIESVPSESDLQIAEALINLPSTAIQIKTTIDHLDKSDLPITNENKTFTETTIHIPESTIKNDEKDDEMVEEIKPKNSSPKSESISLKNNESINLRFETEQEKCENLNAAQSLVQMSESIDHKMNILEASAIKPNEIPDPIAFGIKQNNGIENISAVEPTVALLPIEGSSDSKINKTAKFETSTSKLLKMLEEPCVPKASIIKTTPTKPVVPSGKEKILNFDVAKTSFKTNKSQSPKQKIIIRRTAPSKNIIQNINEGNTSEKIILSRSNNSTQDGSAVQTYTIQTSPESPSDANSIIIQQKIRKISKLPTKLHKLKNSLVSPMKANETKIVNETPDEGIFDINSMPIVLSEDLLTPENIEKMPVVMSDGNIITHQTNPPKLVKKHTLVESDKVAISASPCKPEVKTLLMNPVTENNKVTTPNILSKSSKLRGAKPMLVIDKATGKQKIIMTKPDPTVKEIKQAPALVQSLPQNPGKGEKYIILPTPSSPRPGRTQKILIDPQTGKAHVLVAKGSEASLSTSENKPVSAKLVPSSSDASTPGNTVMIITNAQGAQSRIVLTPEHEKILFPNKQQPNVSQLKTIAHRITTNAGSAQKTAISTIAPLKTQTVVTAKTQSVGSARGQGIATAKAQGIASIKTPGLVSTKNQVVALSNKAPTRIVPKQKSAIITSKGQLIVGGRVASTAQNIAPMPEIRTVPKRIVASEPKKLVQTIQKASSEPLIFLQQKSGAVMQLTAAQFEHLQRTGQIVQKTVAPIQENKIVVQKPINISTNEPVVTTVPKPRVRKTVMESPTPVKKVKHDIAIAPAPSFSPMPPLTTLSNSAATSLVPSVSNTVSVTTTANYSDLDNFEELLPTTAIVKQPEPVVPQPEPVLAAPPASLSDGQLLAVPGEHFGGPHGSFYLCVEDNGTLTPIDNRPLVLENNQLVPMAVEPLPALATQPERRDILEAALANSDVFHADPPRDEVPDFRDLNANVSVHCRVSETSTTLNQPIMTPVEMPTKCDSEPAVPVNIEDGLAVIGVTPHTIPTSLELPITVTDPRIALKTTDPLSNNNYGSSLLPSPSTEMTFATSEDVPMVGPISMPLLTDDESVGKSMPILTDDVTERTVSSVESAVGSPSSIDVRESETEDGSQLWSRRLLTPGSDSSETSSEIPLQPAIQLSVNDMSHHS